MTLLQSGSVELPPAALVLLLCCCCTNCLNRLYKEFRFIRTEASFPACIRLSRSLWRSAALKQRSITITNFINSATAREDGGGRGEDGEDGEDGGRVLSYASTRRANTNQRRSKMNKKRRCDLLSHWNKVKRTIKEQQIYEALMESHRVAQTDWGAVSASYRRSAATTAEQQHNRHGLKVHPEDSAGELHRNILRRARVRTTLKIK